MKYNHDAECNNCSNYTRKGKCKQAANFNIDYFKDDNPHCWHWNRSFTSSIKLFFNRLRKRKK